LGKDHPSLVVTLVNIGLVKAGLKDLPASEAALRRAVAIADAKLDRGNRDAVNAREQLAATLLDEGKNAEAETVKAGK
jgi:hypothetical protein